ncbi:MAG TPA: thioesterase family protein [Sphingomicrobium sp.]|nr:thioesterase family protein [Sphingomicrobium sp.]
MNGTVLLAGESSILSSFRHPVAISPADIDHMGHVNNAVYLKWVQDAVVDYWRSVAPPEAVASHLWVALKHEITYLKPTFLQDTVVAEVIADKVEGARAMFTTVVRRGEEVLSEIKSSWCCLDAASLRPVRLARDIVGRFLPPGA